MIDSHIGHGLYIVSIERLFRNSVNLSNPGIMGFWIIDAKKKRLIASINERFSIFLIILQIFPLKVGAGNCLEVEGERRPGIDV